MLSATNKKGIRDSVKQWSQRRNIPDDVIDDFIEIALSKACRALRIPSIERLLAIEVNDTGYFPVPQDFIEVKELTYLNEGVYVPLERKAIHEVDMTAPVSGDPCYFSRLGNEFSIAPWNLGAEQEVYLYYWSALAPLQDDTSTNWFTLYSPETLLYGALSELADYTRDTEGTQLWNSKFTDNINILQAVEDGAEWSGSTLGVTLAGSTRRRV